MLEPHSTGHATRDGSPDPAVSAVPVGVAPNGARAGLVDPSPEMGRVRAVIDALPEPVLVTDPDGRVRITNPAADRLFAHDPVRDSQDLMSRFEELAPGRGPVSQATATSAPLTVRPRHMPNRWFVLRTVDLGSVEADATPPGTTSAAAAPGSRTVFVLRDVTESRDLRPEREAFLAVLSHELRTPITTIYAGSSVLARRSTLSPPATQTLARDISAEAARLYDLVEDLLVLARLERRILDPLDEPVLLQRSIEATLRVAHERLPDAPVRREGVADPPPVHGDATYVAQACRNLVLASIRFAGPGPERPLIVALDVDTSADEVSVRVLDRGPELTPSELERAFELPDSSAVGRLAGAGVGPFVCRHLVESMGGRTWARNRPEGGVEMGFALRIDERA